jgi:multicomponent Na+:H+ antiporter subunit E
MRLLRHVVLFALLLAFWLLLSGQFDALFIGMGVVAAVIAPGSGPCLESDDRLAEGAPQGPPVLAAHLRRLAPAAASSRPRSRWRASCSTPVAPGARDGAQFRTQLSSPAARTVLANSITLVPGTMTLEVEGDEFTVHSFTPTPSTICRRADAEPHRRGVPGRTAPEPPEMVWESGEARTATDPTPEPDGRTTSPEPTTPSRVHRSRTRIRRTPGGGSMTAFLVALLLIGVLIAVGLHRVWFGPTVFDRLVAVALVSVNGVVVIVLLGFVFATRRCSSTSPRLRAARLPAADRARPLLRAPRGRGEPPMIVASIVLISLGPASSSSSARSA